MSETTTIRVDDAQRQRAVVAFRVMVRTQSHWPVIIQLVDLTASTASYSVTLAR